MRETVTTVLDIMGLLLVAAGLAFFCWPLFGGVSLAFSGGLILIGSALADRSPVQARRRVRAARRGKAGA